MAPLRSHMPQFCWQKAMVSMALKPVGCRILHSVSILYSRSEASCVAWTIRSIYVMGFLCHALSHSTPSCKTAWFQCKASTHSGSTWGWAPWSLFAVLVRQTKVQLCSSLCASRTKSVQTKISTVSVGHTFKGNAYKFCVLSAGGLVEPTRLCARWFECISHCIAGLQDLTWSSLSISVRLSSV